MLVPSANADGLGLAIQQIDVTQFPTVRAYVSVANATGVPITGLSAQAFQVQEDGKPVENLQVEPIVDSQEPIATALVIDTSGSMADEEKIDRARDAASAFIDALGAKDRVTIVAFSSQVNVVQDYAADHGSLKAALGTLAPKGDTQLYDAVAQTAKRQGAQAERRKALIVLTDGDDTKSSASLDASIAAAVAASSPVYAIGLGTDVKKEVLDQLAAATGGQSIYVEDAGQLKPALLSIGDQLRRQYVLRWTSKIDANDQAHGIAVQAQYSGQQVTGLGNFKVSAPLTVNVSGLVAGASVSSVQRVQVDVSSAVQSVQLLVDDQPRGSLQTAPYVFEWDPRSEPAGQRRVVVRVTDTRGSVIDKAFPVTVAPPVIVLPTVVVTPQPTAASAPVATTVIPTETGSPLLLILGLLLLLLVVGAGTIYLATRPRRQLQPAVASVAAPVENDDTWDIGTVAVGSSSDEDTFVRPAIGLKARLVVTRLGEQREVALDGSEVIVGRDDHAAISIKDPLASRQHARILRESNQYWVEDMKSLNGTQVNGETLSSKRRLAHNDRISIGETVLTFLVEPR
jgi:VWFA-related protein